MVCNNSFLNDIELTIDTHTSIESVASKYDLISRLKKVDDFINFYFIASSSVTFIFYCSHDICN